MKYKIIDAETIKNLIEFLDEIQFDAAASKEKDDLHKVNFCGWAIQELLNSYNVVATKDFRKCFKKTTETINSSCWRS